MCEAEVLPALQPCGYILQALECKYIALQCYFCLEKWGDWSEFLQHQRAKQCAQQQQQTHEEYVNIGDDMCHSTGPIEDDNVIIEVVPEDFAPEPDLGEDDNQLETEPDQSDDYRVVESFENSVLEAVGGLEEEPQEFANEPEEFANQPQEFETNVHAADQLSQSSDDASLQLDDDFYNDLKNDSNQDGESATSLSDCSDVESDASSTLTKKFSISFVSVNRQTLDFIECYQQQPCLWDPSADDYNDPNACDEANQKIAKFFQDKYNVTPTKKNLNTAAKRLNTFFKRYTFGSKRKTEARREYFEKCSFLTGIDLDDRIQIKNISSKKIIFGDIDDFTLAFIDTCEKHPVLWDNLHIDFRSNSKRKEAYDEISQTLHERFGVEFSKEELYDSIHRLKRYYYSIVDKERKNEPLSKSNLVYLEKCKFLPPTNRIVSCHICDRTLRSDATLQVHLVREHNIGQLPFKCGYCELRFPIRANQKEHEIRVHTKNFEWFCQYCQKGFASRRDTEVHELVHTGERKSVCDQCGRAFRLKSQLKEHVRVVHQRDRCFKCTLCPKDFLRKRHLDDHMKGHLNIRDKVCDECGRTFTNQHALLRHKQLHAGKKFVCKMCGERFHQFVGLHNHMKSKHKLVSKKPDEDEAVN